MIDQTKYNWLEQSYDRYNHRKFIHPDPLEFLYLYPNKLDREIVGLIASALAYGRVAQILKSVQKVLDIMPKPAEFLRYESEQSIRKHLKGFKHRFTTDQELSSMLTGAKRLIETNGSIEKSFKKHLKRDDTSIIRALIGFVGDLRQASECERTSVLACPSDGSACKRWNLYLRWLVRKDNVDPGGWKIPASILIVPVDVHMHRIGLALGMTSRKQADMKTAIEITEAFKIIAPDDPVKYDFCLTRPGIRNESNILLMR